MSSFSFSSDEPIIREVWSCTECIYCSTKKHFSDGPSCPLCFSDATKIEEQEQTLGMSEFEYRKILTIIEEEASGVGAATVTNIENHFENGDDFVDAAEVAYKQLALDDLQSVKGVGKSSAKEIALTVADDQGWEDGAIFTY